MSSFSFTRVNSSLPLYVAPDDNGWCAFLMIPDAHPKDDNLSFSDTANYPGCYLFAAAAPADIPGFVARALTFFTGSQQPQTQWSALVWLTDTVNPLTAANTLMLYLQQGGGKFTMLKAFSYSFGNNFVTLAIPVYNVTVTPDYTNNRFLISPQSPNVRWFMVNSNQSQSIMDPNGVEVPFTGRGRGRMRFVVGLNSANDFNTKAYNFSLKYFFLQQQNLNELNYPLVVPGSLNDYISFQASLYPIDLLNQNGLNTYLAFTGITQSTSSIPPPTKPTLLNTYFMTVYGYPVSYMPFVSFTSDGASKNFPDNTSALMVMCERNTGNTSLPWYLAPAGRYTLTLSTAYSGFLNKNGQMLLLAGLAGAESVAFTPQFVDGNNNVTGNGDYMRFFPNNNALATQFPVTASQPGGSRGKWLAGGYNTSWAGIELNNAKNSPAIYNAQPKGSALFSPGQDIFVDNKKPFLGNLLVNSGNLSTAAVIPFPVASYGPATTFPTGVNIATFEQQVISPSRKGIIAQATNVQLKMAAALRQSAQTIQTTSPQGFYVEVAVDNVQHTAFWNLLLLARNQFKLQDGSMSPLYSLAFHTLSPQLQSAFQSNQLFLVISFDNGVLGQYDNDMNIQGWPFNMVVPQSSTFGQYKNVFIFKFCSGRLIDRVQNTQLWTSPEVFNDTSNGGLDSLTSWLQQYIQDGIDRYNLTGDEDYHKFFLAATDKQWQGVLSLKVDISLQEFPADLQGLLAGIDLSRFNAHHFGIDLSVVHNNSGNLAMQNQSSLFGLIDYEDVVFESLGYSLEAYRDQAPINTDVDYDFRVLDLRVLFLNSKIASYNCNIALTVNKLFGEQVNPDNRKNLIILNGTYENHDGVPSYSFDTVFDNLMILDNSVIQNVEIVKAGFNTIVPQNHRSQSNTVNSSFGFWGFINFKNLPGTGKVLNFDLLSFGNEAGDQPNGYGLYFSGLRLNMSFPIATPATKTYVFDISHVSFDIAQSWPRTASLYSHFPLKISSMVSGDNDSLPSAQGFLDVQLPSLAAQQSISGPWYGITYTVNMGTLGALASAAGFNATLLTGWSVGASGAAAGMKLPGVNPQASFFNLQSVLRLDIGNLQISVADDNVSYLMRINNIELKVLSRSFPPNGNINFFLFGNPDSDAQPESLGWYAAYIEKNKTKSS